MSLRLYFDHHVLRAIAVGVRQQGIDVLTTDTDGTADVDDEFILQSATDLDRVVFTQDRDFFALAAAWQQPQRDFTGVVYAHQLGITIGAAIHDLVLIASLMNPDDIRNRVEFLPLSSVSISITAEQAFGYPWRGDGQRGAEPRSGCLTGAGHTAAAPRSRTKTAYP